MFVRINVQKVDLVLNVVPEAFGLCVAVGVC